MQITLNVDGAAFGATLEQLIEVLSQEQKGALVERVVLQWLTEPIDAERVALKARLDEKVKATAERNYDRYSIYDRDRDLEKFRSIREQTVERIRDAAVSVFRDRVIDLVTTDQQLDRVWVIVREELIKAFPAMCQMALTQWFAGQMTELQDSILVAQNAVWRLENVTRAIQERLGMPGG